MVIPKQFNDMRDLETMLMSSLLGILECLKEDIISLPQAENYWIANAVIDTLEELQFSSDVIELFKQCNDMFEQSRGNAVSEEQLHKMIDETKKLISANYTEYDDQGMVS
ncbi:MAG: DUF3969 family protein [Erysipelotrichaceae bacterium]|nr:DUF3969 family protein [Erysipelotrichaceae bacterium]